MKNKEKTVFSILIKSTFVVLFVAGIFALTSAAREGDNDPTEEDYYKIVRVPSPEGSVLEVGGLTPMPNGEIAVCTRRGDVYIIENPNAPVPHFRLFASGLHEILGIAYKDGHLYCAQRGELTKLIDRNGDGKCDRYETVYTLPITGHYHEYSFGPKIAPDGSFYVTGNISFGSSDWWAGKSNAPWRGWLMKINENAKNPGETTMQPWAAGLRSPCGIGMVDGEFFYGDNQGDWMGSGFVMHVEKGDFAGHPASLNWADRPESPVKMRKEMVYKLVDPRDNPKLKPEYVKNEPMTTIYEMSKKHYPNMGIKPPSVWLPHGVLGISTSEMITDDTKGSFGPFAGQLFVGDQGMSKIARVFLEKVNGQYQGAAFDFRSNFRSGVLRMCWGNDNAMYVGGTNRGWGSTGKEPYGLERLVWTGKMPFEMRAMRAMPDGFEIEFTVPVDKATAENVESYTAASYIYKYHPVYGSPLCEYKEHDVRGAKLSADGMRVRVVVDSLREGFVHDIKLEGVRSAKGNLPVLHPQGFYTLNSIPTGAKATFALVAPRKRTATGEFEDKGAMLNTPDNQMKEAAPTPDDPKNTVTPERDEANGIKGGNKTNKKPKTQPKKEAKVAEKPKPAAPAAPVINQKEVTGLLSKWTCNACHKSNERAVGPAFAEIAKRKYSVSEMVNLIYEPKPKNWPDFETPMAPMPHVPKKDAEKIAAWINSLAK